MSHSAAGTAFCTLLCAALLSGCGGGDKPTGPQQPPPPPPPQQPQTPTVVLSVASASTSVNTGASSTVTVNVVRGGGFTGPVVVSATGAPAGVTVAPVTIASESTSGTLTIAASSGATAGVASLSVTGTASGVTIAPQPLSLTVVITPVHTTLVPATAPGFTEARTSQIVTNGSVPIQVFDDFTPAESGPINTVAWQGIYCVQQPGAGAPAPTASRFTISFYSDAAGRPNTATPLQTSTYTLAQAGQTFERNVPDLRCGTAENTTWAFYRYSVQLAAPFNLTAGTKYWISIQATTPSYDVFFGWRGGTDNNRNSLQLFGGAYTTFNVDRAYSLSR